MSTTRRRAPTLGVALALGALACAGPRPDDLGVREDGRLAPCPSSPNCVSSDAEDELHRVEPFALAVAPDEAWARVLEVVKVLPRSEIVMEAPDYLHIESTTRIMRYVDDLELQLRPDDGITAVRSASRVGYGDMGANRARVEDLRERLREAGALRAGD